MIESHVERRITSRQVTLVDQAWNNVTVFQRVVVERTKDVCRDDTRELAPVLLEVGPARQLLDGQVGDGRLEVPVRHVDHSLCVGVAKVGIMRGAVVDHRLIDGIRCLVWKDARRQRRHALFDLVRPIQLLPNARNVQPQTLWRKQACKTLSFIRMLSRKKSSLCLMFLKSPPTMAAR